MSLENKLLHAIKSKNKDKVENVFEMIYYEYGMLVTYIISKYVEKSEDVEELVNDVFIKFYQASFKTEIKNIKYYLVSTSKNISLDFYRKKSNKIDITYNEENVFEYVESKDSFYVDLITEMQKVLSDEEINIIVLHLVYDYTFKELGEKYNKATSTIAYLYDKALKKFKKGIK